GIAGKRSGGRRMVQIPPLWRLHDCGWYRTRSIALGAGLSSLTWLGGHSRPHVRVRRRSVPLAFTSARRLTAGNFVRNDPPSERILKIGPGLSTAGHEDESGQPSLAAEAMKWIRSRHRTGAPKCRSVPFSPMETHRQYRMRRPEG